MTQGKMLWQKSPLLPLPDFITSARRELMLSAAFLVFFVGAIVARQEFVNS